MLVWERQEVQAMPHGPAAMTSAFGEKQECRSEVLCGLRRCLRPARRGVSIVLTQRVVQGVISGGIQASSSPSAVRRSQATSKAFVLDFETCKEEEKREPQQAQHLDRRVDRDPAQHLGADRDPEDDREHDRW